MNLNSRTHEKMEQPAQRREGGMEGKGQKVGIAIYTVLLFATELVMKIIAGKAH